MNRGFDLLEVVATLPVEEEEGAIVGATYHYVVVVDGDGVDDGAVVRDLAQLMAFGQLPDADFVSAGGGECVLVPVHGHGANTFFVMRQCLEAFTLSNVPEPNHSVS